MTTDPWRQSQGRRGLVGVPAGRAAFAAPQPCARGLIRSSAVMRTSDVQMGAIGRQGANHLKTVALPATDAGGVGAHHQVELHRPEPQRRRQRSATT